MIDRLVPGETALGGLLEVVALQAGVRAPRLGVIVDNARVVNGAQMAIRVFSLNDAEEVVPVGHRLGADKVVFVCDGPPDVAKCRETRDGVAEIEIVDFIWHGFVAPCVIRVEEDAVGLDARGLKLEEALLEKLKVLRIESGVVVGFAGDIRRAVGWEGQHLLALSKRFWQHAGAGLVELAGHAGEGVYRVLLGGKEVCIGGGAERKVGRAIRILEVELMRGGHRTVVAGLRWSAGEAAGVCVEFGGRAGGFVAPLAWRIRHEADAVGRVAVVEAVDLDGAVLLSELRRQGDVAEGISGRGSFEGDFVEAPSLDAGRTCRDNRLCRDEFRVEGGGQSSGRAELQDISAVHGILSPANFGTRCTLSLV